MTRRNAIHAAAALTAAGLAVLYAFPPAEYSFYPRCPIFAATHLLCPGCGGTRAMHALLHLRLAEALHYNALITVAGPILLLWLGFSYVSLLRYDRFPQVRVPAAVWTMAGLIIVAFTIARNTGVLPL